MKIAVRVAHDDDLKDLVRLDGYLREDFGVLRGGPLYLLRNHRQDPIEDSYRASLEDPDSVVLVGLVGEVAAGFAVATLQRLTGEYTLADVTEIFVLKEMRGVGVGDALMSALLEWAQEHGADGIDSRAMPGDRNTKNFFEGNGLVARAIVVHRDLREV